MSVAPNDSPADQPNDPARWERDAARKLDEALSAPDPTAPGDDYYAPGSTAPSDEEYVVPPAEPPEFRAGLRYDSPSIGPVTAGGSGWRRHLRLRQPTGCAMTAIGLGVLIVLVLLVLFAFSGGDDDGSLVGGGGGSPPASASPSGTASASPSGTSVATSEPTATVPDRLLLQIGESVIDAILDELYVNSDIPEEELDYIEDALRDWLDSISGNTPTYTPPAIDMRLYGGVRLNLTGPGVMEAWGNTIYECGTNEGGRIVVCPTDVQSMPAAGGDVWMFAMAFAEAVPQASTDHSFTYSAVFDSDGDSANDWQFFPPFDFDLFRDTDRWYQLVWDHSAGQWLISVTQIDGNQQPTVVPSAVRAVIEGDTIVFFIPASEFALDAPPYRLTSFGHDGLFSESDRGADVSGTDPTAPLTVPSDEDYLAMPEAR